MEKIANVPEADVREKNPITADIYKLRRKRLYKELHKSVAIVQAGAASPQLEGRFCANSNFAYLTGLHDPQAIALFTTAASKSRYILFWRPPTQKDAVWHGSRPGLKEIKQLAGADCAYPLDKFAEKLPAYLKGAGSLYHTFGVDETNDKIILDVRNELLQQKYVAQTVPQALWELGEVMEKLRICKEPQEITLLRKAVAVTASAYQALMETVRAGMYEYEIEGLLAYLFHKEGAQEQSFGSIVASGANATVLHYMDNNSRIAENDLVLVDAGARYQYYCADVTRTWPVSGKFTPAQKAIYQAVLSAQKTAIAHIKPGASVPEFHKKVIATLTECMVDLGILHGKVADLIEKKEYEQFYMHKSGHFLGLDVHDSGGYFSQESQRTFQPGMVITVEPGCYIRTDAEKIPTQFCGIGVRIEDDILVTQEGCEVLSAGIPKEVNDLEELLRRRKLF